jgi:hypothetical protein
VEYLDMEVGRSWSGVGRDNIVLMGGLGKVYQIEGLGMGRRWGVTENEKCFKWHLYTWLNNRV